jgi:hypothetical protein
MLLDPALQQGMDKNTVLTPGGNSLRPKRCICYESSRLFKSSTIAVRTGYQPERSNWFAKAWLVLPLQFSSSRAIREYTNDHYLPAAAGDAESAANSGKACIGVLQWQKTTFPVSGIRFTF